MSGWERYADKYDIHQETFDYHQKHKEMESKPYTELTIQQAREQSYKAGVVLSGDVSFPGKTTQHIVPSPYDPTGLAVTVFKPQNCENDPAILVFFHGGGLILGAPRIVEPALKIISNESAVIVVNCSYRLLPNKCSPCAPLEDGVIATRWVLENKETIGGSSTSRVGVGGDSSGGHIAAIAANHLLGKLDFQVLVYPIVDLSITQSSFKEFENVPGQSKSIVAWYYEHSIKDMPDAVNDPSINPMKRTNMDKDPKTLMILAELDPLIGVGLDYANKLESAGVSVQTKIVKGVPHAFFSYREVFKTKSPEAYAHVVNFLKQF